jgi:hypothetical protein
MIDQTEQMLSGIEPDKRFTRNRIGNPFEKAIAVANKELTEDEISELLDNARAAEIFNKLPDSIKNIVATGLSKMWIIKRFGEAIVDDDQKILEPLEDMKRYLKEGVDIVEKRSNWQPDAVKSLVQLAASKDDGEKRNCVETVNYLTSDYIRGLDLAGSIYYDGYKLMYQGNNEALKLKEKVRDYLNVEREDKVREVRHTADSLAGDELYSLANRKTK